MQPDMDPVETTDQSPKKETVSQSEIETLLAGVGADESIGAAIFSGKAQSGMESAWHKIPEFPEITSFSTSEMRNLRARHEEFVNALAARFVSYMRMECALQLSKLETSSFQQFTDGLSNPTYLTLLKLEPLSGICLLDVPLRVALCIVNRELGGAGKCSDEPRDLTRMEASLISKVVEKIVGEWCAAWSNTLDMRPKLVGYKNSARFLRTYSPETPLLVAGVQVRIGESVDEIQLALPCATLEPLIAKLNTENENSGDPAAKQSASPLKWNRDFDGVEVRISAELPVLELTAAQIANLKPGDVLPLADGFSDQVRLCLESTPTFTGNLGTSGNFLAVKILKAL